MKNIFWIIGLVLFVTNISAQELSITGTIVDKDSGEPLVGAKVTHNATGNEVLTDFDGNFTITGAKAGVNALTVSYISYQETKLNRVMVTEGKETELNIKLKRLTGSSTGATNFLALESKKKQQS